MRDATPSAAGPTRRLVAVGALGAAAVALTGCGIRLEDDAPSIPLVPKREPIAAEPALLRLFRAVQTAAVAPLVTSDPIAPLLPTIHARQATVLHDALRQRGVPEDALPSATPAPTPTSSGTGSPGSGTSSASTTSSPSPSASPSPVRRTVADVETAILAAAAGVATAEAELRPTLVALLGQASAAVRLADPASSTAPPAGPGASASPGASAGPDGSASPTPTPTPSATPSWSSAPALPALVTATRRATFLLEVSAARSTRKVRDAWLVDVTALHALTADLVAAAGPAAPAPELGQSLPRPVTTPAEAATLATEAVGTLLATFGSELRGLTDADPQAAFAAVPGWIGSVAAVGHRHGLPLTAFPGLT